MKYSKIFFLFFLLQALFCVTLLSQNLIISEVAPFGSTDKTPWIEIYNPNSKVIDATKIKIVINDNFEYKVPKALAKIPANSYIVIKLDGKESQNIYRFRNNSLSIHSSLLLKKAIIANTGHIALYNGTKLIDFVSWGAPASAKSLTKERNEIWKKKWFVNPNISFGDYDQKESVKRNDYVIGRNSANKNQLLNNWSVYSKNESTPGAANKVPKVFFFNLSDKAIVNSADIAIGWNSGMTAKSYKFQLSKDADFKNIIEDVVLQDALFKPKSELTPGSYFYRVKTIDGFNKESEWSNVREIISKKIGRPKADGADGAVENVLTDMQYRRQRKDSRLLCIDGCASELNAAATRYWDNIHPDVVPAAGHHGSMNCVRASISMMASFYGGDLCQDRIAYFSEEENVGAGNGIPEGDLAHEVGMSYSSVDGGEETETLEWALDATTTFMDANPTFNQIRNWIDNNQPIMTRTPGHLRTMNGYRIDDSNDEWVHILDPWTGERWELYTTWNAGARGTWVGPVSAPTVRSNEPSITTDSDGDGVMDFDEQVRFLTGRFDKDSDNDGVEDKNDIREYVFTAADGYSKRTADIDADGIRKENDPDNDGDTFNDGCEDKNFNGKFEPGLGETDNFALTAVGACVDKPIHAIVVFDRSGSMVYPYTDPVKKYDRAAEAATLFLDTWLANDVPANSKVGLVFYDHTAYYSTGAGANTTLDLLNVTKRDNIVNAFATNRPNYGSTSIGGGINKAMDVQGFNPASIPVDNQNRVMIVLTDGMENTAPFMDDPAITSALATNKVDGYVLGIGDETQIDVTKLNNLADILNHHPASLATELDAFQLEKFFLQVLAETQGLEFNTDPIEEIALNTTKTHTVRVNAGASKATFVIAWNEPNGKITFTLKNPLGQTVAADVIKSNNRYQVSVKRNPMAGNWTLTLNASSNGNPAPSNIHYSVMALEKNISIKSNFTVQAPSLMTGSPLLLTVDLSKQKIPVANATVQAQIRKPKVGIGNFLSNTKVLIAKDIKPMENRVKMTSKLNKLSALTESKIRNPYITETILLNDKGIDGDEIAGDGRYSAYYKNTNQDGVYNIRFMASTNEKNAPLVNREKLISIPISTTINPNSSIPVVKSKDYSVTTNETTIKLVVIPRDKFNNKVGPGKEDMISTNVKAKNIKVTDNLDGSYEVEMIVSGKVENDINILPRNK